LYAIAVAYIVLAKWTCTPSHIEPGEWWPQQTSDDRRDTNTHCNATEFSYEWSNTFTWSRKLCCVGSNL